MRVETVCEPAQLLYDYYYVLVDRPSCELSFLLLFTCRQCCNRGAPIAIMDSHEGTDFIVPCFEGDEQVPVEQLILEGTR